VNDKDVRKIIIKGEAAGDCLTEDVQKRPGKEKTRIQEESIWQNERNAEGLL
jgi:hypothetical protein